MANGQMSVMVPDRPKRIAIVGTAPTWKMVPWKDKDLTIACLNDAYMLGVPRADVWFDLHPFDKFWYRPKAVKSVNAYDIPVGYYVRPEGHVEWLAQQKMPVYVQKPISPNMIRFPREEVEAKWKPYFPEPIDGNPPPVYFQSTPAWILAWAFQQGYQEAYIYGIHLATQWEYVEQRPNFEYLLGVVRGAGMKVFIPKSAPLCRAESVYAYEGKPNLDVERVQRQIAQAKAQRQALEGKRKARKWWQSAGDIERQIKLLAAHVIDKELQIQRLMLAKRAA